MVQMHHSNNHSVHAPDQTGRPSSIEPSIDDVVIPQGQILMDWLNDIQVDAQDNPETKENDPPLKRWLGVIVNHLTGLTIEYSEQM